MPNILQKVFNFTVAYAEWVKAGKPLRTDERVSELFQICSNCPTQKYIRKSEHHGECDECGCRIINRSPQETILNKLAWPTTGCPDGHWSEDVEEESAN